MTQTSHPMTQEGYEQIQTELAQLKQVERPAIIEAISHARELGDLKENAEYHSAKDRQGFIEAKIKQLESKLSRAQIIDISEFDNQGKVIFGAYVTTLNLDNDATLRFRIVGEDEADLGANKLSVTSPLARGLIGKMLGDQVEISTPKGLLSYEITDVSYTT